MYIKAITGFMLPGLVAAALVGCGGGSSDNSTAASASSGGTSSGGTSSGGSSSGGTSSSGASSGSSSGGTTSINVGATVTGLAGSGLVLQLSSSALTTPEDVTVAANATTASFTATLTTGATYTVSVTTPPSFPTQQCAVSGGSGTVAAANISATVTCTTKVGKFLFTSNNGSGATGNSVSIFTIGVGGALTAVGTPVAAGTSPYAMTLDSTGTYLYVGNEQSGNISEYSINQTTGALTPLSPATVASGNTSGSLPEALAVDESGHFLYAANETEGDIAGYTIGAGGVLTAVTTGLTPGDLASPDALAASPNGEFIYVANHGNSAVHTVGSVTAYSVNPTTGALTLVADYPTGIALVTTADGPVGLAIDPTGKYLYMGNYNSANTTQPSQTLGYTINANGMLTAMTSSPFAAASTGQMAIDPSGKYLITAEATTTPTLSDVGVFAIGSDGSLTAAPNSPYVTNTGPYGIAVDPSGQRVYASDNDTSEVEGYGLNSSGTLSTFGQVATGANPDWIVID